jgi:streptolysin S family bacteriocin protoxin
MFIPPFLLPVLLPVGCRLPLLANRMAEQANTIKWVADCCCCCCCCRFVAGPTGASNIFDSVLPLAITTG